MHRSFFENIGQLLPMIIFRQYEVILPLQLLSRSALTAHFSPQNMQHRAYQTPEPADIFYYAYTVKNPPKYR